MVNYLMLFGKNSHGQLGFEIEGKDVIYNQDNYTSIPIPLFGFSVRKVSCGVQHTGFITANGSVYTFGNGSFGKLGVGSTEDIRYPCLVGSINKAIDIECGNDHTIVLQEEGSVFTWGSASLGRLGIGKTTAQLYPKKVSVGVIGARPISVHAGGASSGCVMSNGTLLTWGYNKYGQLGIGSMNDQFTPITVSFFSENGIRVTDFSIGDRHMAAIDQNGELYAWGCNDEYQLGNGTSFSERRPISIRVKSTLQQFKMVRCGGDYTTAVTREGGLYIWGTFVKEYSSKTPKLYMENVIDIDCSSDCGKHVIARTTKKEVWSFGWNRYGQAANDDDEYIDTVPISKSKVITGFPSQVSTGSYHSAILYDDYCSFLAQLIWINKIEMSYHLISRENSIALSKYRDHNGDTILHLIAKKKYPYSSVSQLNTNQDYLGPNLKELNNLGYPPYYYNAQILEWPFDKSKYKSPIDFVTPATNENCLHYFARLGKLDEFDLAIKHGANHRLRNKSSERPFDLIDKEDSFNIKQKYGIFDIGIVYTEDYKELANSLKASLNENFISCCLISNQNQKFDCYGYIFFVSKTSLSSEFHIGYLLNHISKQPMISIWAMKTPITDPSLESCIFRSQLVDFSSDADYNDSFSVLMDGIFNIFANDSKTNSGGSGGDGLDQVNDDGTSSKLDDTSALSISGSESVFISCDPNKIRAFKPLFDYLTQNGIVIVPREKKVISSWVVVVIISEVDFTPLVRDEISLAENRGKPLIPIYFVDKILDEASRYTFSNSPKIQFNENGFKQLLLLIKLNFNLIHQTEKLLKLNNKIK